MVSRHVKAASLVLACVIAACAVSPPRVVAVVTPYVPTFYWIDPAGRAIGKMECDVMGQPAKFINPNLPPERQAYVALHEMLHAEQTRVHGGCFAFQRRMASDSIFRLEREAEVYCSVNEAQREMKLTPDPTVAEIVEMLRFKYYAEYDSVTVVRAMPCGA